LALFYASDGEGGCWRVRAALARGGERAGGGLARGLVREPGPGAVPAGGSWWRSLAGLGLSGPVLDLVSRDFSAAVPGARMAGDIACIPAWAGWAHLALVIGCATRMVTGWSMDGNHEAPLIAEAVKMAARYVELPDGAIFHGDGGSDCASGGCAMELAGLGIARSAGRAGIGYDNAVAGSVDGMLEVGLVRRKVHAARGQAVNDIARWIGLRHDQARLDSALGCRTPREVMNELPGMKAAA
jgi:putative transposase